MTIAAGEIMKKKTCTQALTSLLCAVVSTWAAPSFAQGSAAPSPVPNASAPLVAPAVPPTPAHAGFLKSIQGDVHLQGLGGELRTARAGDAVASVDRIITGADSGASAVLRDGTTLVLGPSSRLELKDFSFDATTQDGSLLVSLVRGSLRMITGLIGKIRPDSVRIETQTATISIRGTDFTLDVDGPAP